MEKDLEKLITVDGMVEAQVIKAKLENFGIISMLKFEPVGRLMGITMDGLGKVQILVKKEDLKKAFELILPDEENKKKY